MSRRFYIMARVAVLCLMAARTVCATEMPVHVLPTCPEGVLDNEVLRNKASEWFARGTQLVEKTQYGAAAEAFRCSNRLVSHPSTLLNLAKAVLLAGDEEEALRLYESFVSEYPAHDKRSAVTSEIDRLKQQNEASSKPVDAFGEATSTPTASDAPVVGPSTPIVPPVRNLQASAVSAVSLDFNGRDHRKDAMKKWGWALTGVGSAGMIIGVSFQILASYNYLRMQDDLWWSEFAERRRNYERYQRAATIALSISGAVLVGGMTLLLVSRGKSKRETINTAQFSVAPWKLSMGVVF